METALVFRAAIARAAGVVFGLATQVVLLATVPYLFLFLRYGGDRPTGDWLLVDVVLTIQFAVVHSTLLMPRIRTTLTRRLASQLYASLFALATCGGLWLMIGFWRESPAVFWDATGISRTLILAGFYASWVALTLSLSVTGFGYQTGWTQWKYWLRRESLPRREFVERGAYRWLRHPVYFSFLGLIWFTPRMTADHAVLTAVWTVYIFIGSWLKDRRLAFYLGDAYKQYASRVPGFPGIPFGSLGKWRATGSFHARSAASIVSPGPKASITQGV